jgi:hypothetical protein
MLGKIKQAAQAVTGAVSDTVGNGLDKLQGQVEEFLAASQSLPHVGYRVGDIELEVSLPPRFIVHFSREGSAPDEAFQAVLANHRDNRTFCLVVNLLRQANRLLDKVKMPNRRLYDVEVSLGIIPGVRLRYAPDAPARAAVRGDEAAIQPPPERG